MKSSFLYLFSVILICFSCSKDEDPDIIIDPDPSDTLVHIDYFPPLSGSDWATLNPEDLDWNVPAVNDLYDLLEVNHTRAFIVLVDGKIVLEKYFGKDLLNIGDFGANTNWYWASAGKTLTAFTLGKAQEEGYLDIHDASSQYLGSGWTSMSPDKEHQIKIWHQLSMTTGLDDKVSDNHAFQPEDLVYLADPGTRWAYHNAPYTLLDAVVESAVDAEFEDYFNQVLRDPIGMNGFWSWIGNDHVYFSTARSMARYGLLISNMGEWDGKPIMEDTEFLSQMTTTSQDINNAYGLLWWLNGKESYMLPELQLELNGSLTPSAPDDMYSGIGKNGQYLSVIPSLNMVMVRMGDNPDQAPVPLLFQTDIWNAMNEILPE